MDHLHHNHHHQSNQAHHPLHWNYTSSTPISAPITSTPISHNANNANTWTPPTTRGIKRAMSESDCEDIYSEESSKEHASSIENDSCQHLSRKKRRGVIEKKRRDRINNSLTELKRLVPSAFEKQGSAKLEKAEILQLTVDHLKSLQSKGIDSLGFDPQRFAMDYHIIGFRECASEVARYLVTIEGMDIQDPLRLRLMSHLQCFVAQRELSLKSSSTSSPSSNWPSFQNTYQPNYQNYQTYPTTTPITPHQSHQSQSQQSFSSSYLPSGSSYLSSQSNNTSLSTSAEYSSGYGSANTSVNNTSSTNQSAVNSSTSHSSVTPTPITSVAGQTTTSANDSHDTQPIYTDLSNSNDRLLNLNGSAYHYSNNGQLYGQNANNAYNNNNNNNNSKPYRPWHPEMAY